MKYPTLRGKGFVVPLRLTNSYESGRTGGSRTRKWLPSSSGPKTTAATQLSIIRRRARDAVRNDPWAKTSIGKFTSNVTGTGIQPFPQHPDKNIRKALKELWSDWIFDADADGMLDFYGLQTLAARSIFQDGESLARIQFSDVFDGPCVPMQIQMIPADQLPEDKNETLSDGGEIINGIEFDSVGRRVAYHLWNKNPGEAVQHSIAQKLERIPACEIVHTYSVLDPGQVRGMPELATVLVRLKSLNNFDDAVLFRQEVANLFAGFVTKQPSAHVELNPVTGLPKTYDNDAFTAIASLEPGSMQELNPGESVEFSNPPDAGSTYDGFMRQQLLAAFASVGQPYEIGSGDLRGISDRVLRVVVNEFHRQIEQFQWNTFIHQFCRRIWAAWMDSVVLSGVLPVDDYYQNRRLYMRVRWVPQGWAYFNPVQDVQSQEKQVQAGFKSRTSVRLEQGEDPDEIDDEIANENAIADQLGFSFTSDPRTRSGSNNPPPSGGVFFDNDEVTNET